MIKKTDELIVSDSFYGPLLGINSINRGKSTLIVDDKNFSLGKFYTISKSLFDVKTIESINKLNHVELEVELYRSIELELIFQGNKRICFSNNIVNNLIEINRKFGANNNFSFDQDSLLSQIEIISLNALTSGNKDFTKFCEAYLDKKLNQIIESYWKSFIDESEDLSFRYLILFFRSFYHWNFGLQISRSEFYLLFLKIISGPCEIYNNSIKSEYLNIFKGLGGTYKKAHINDLIFDNGKPWSIELSTYDGVLHPKRVLLLGNSSEYGALSLKLDRFYSYYYERYNNISSPKEDLYNKVTVLFDEKAISSSRPYLVVKENETDLEVFQFYRSGPTSKADFFVKSVRSELSDFFNNHLLLDINKYKLLQVEEKVDLVGFDEAPLITNSYDENFVPKFPDIFYFNGPSSYIKTKNITYLGQQNCNKEGLDSLIGRFSLEI